MGVNGLGKTTVIHALACLYQPDGKGENHRFPEFFVPNTDALWNGSKLNVVNEITDSNGRQIVQPSIEYSKTFDRWCPRYNSRPKRNVYYIGIESCMPDIEKKNINSRIIYRTKELMDGQSEKIIKMSAYILNKDYKQLLDNTYNEKHFLGVSLTTGLKYSSLSMGSGEQRVIKIISTLLKAEPYSLVLIDEIDLLLHVSSLKRLIKKLYEIAKSKHIQIVFTTHSLEIARLGSYVKIQYIDNIAEGKDTLVYEKITPELIYSMTGELKKPFRIYVEDSLAKAIVVELIRKRNKSSSVDVLTYGAIENAFTLSASYVLRNDATDGVLIVLDGDRYRGEEEKKAQIQKKLSGTEDDSETKREKARDIISEFNLQDSATPEEFIFNTIARCIPSDNEIWVAATEIKAVSDSHEWLGLICNNLGCDYSYIAREVFLHAYESKKDEIFIKYIHPIETWIESNC
jgi:ABC-type lipoprotein export system ATPase subunit